MFKYGPRVDGRQLDVWPASKDYLGWVVETAGPVNLDLEDRTVMYNNGVTRLLPSGFRMILNGLENNMAFCYHNQEGVIRIPVELLRPIVK